MKNLSNVTRSTDARERYTEPKNKPASKEHSSVHSRGLDTSSNDNDGCACKHSSPSAESIVARPSKEDSGDRPNVVSRRGINKGGIPRWLEVRAYMANVMPVLLPADSLYTSAQEIG